jgi:pyruvate/2-oxoglutarate dehydrogenase complex dihydrolipoamide acyltransferase (E2) component
MVMTLKIPTVAVSMQEGTIVEWLVENGGTVNAGQPIYALELEKSAIDIEAPASGTLKHAAEAGQTYKVGEVIGYIE